jgi:hypothetical protein
LADEQRSSPCVEVAFGERERFLDAQPGAPQHDDDRAQPPAVAVLAGVAHHGDDLLNRRRVGRVRSPCYAAAFPRV